MKIFSPVNHQATPPLTNPAHLLWHSGEEWRRSCSRPGYVLDSDCPGEGPKTALTNTRSSFQSSSLLTAWCCPFAVTVRGRLGGRWELQLQGEGGLGGGRGAAGSSTVHEGFPFLFSKICTRERSMLITCAQQAMMIYCERHEAEIKESQSVRYWVCRWTFHWECLQSRWNFPSRSWTPLFTRVFLTRTTTINIQIFKGCWRKKEGFIL